MPQEFSLYIQREKISSSGWIWKFFFFISLRDFCFQYFHQEGKDGVTSKGVGQCCECAKKMTAIGISFWTKRVLILYKSPSSIPEYITSQLNHCSSLSFRPELWFLNAGTLVTFIVKKIIIIMNYNIYMKTSYCRNKPRITVYFPSQKFPLNPLFPPLACHLSWSLLESVKMHCTVFLRLSHVSLPLMQAIKPAGFFSLTKIQSD